jgi:ArsR family metal-binding transcriptional regulator
MEIPTLSEELVEVLDRAFPEKCPDPSWSERKIWMYTGKRELIRTLLGQLKVSTTKIEGTEKIKEGGENEDANSIRSDDSGKGNILGDG